MISIEQLRKIIWLFIFFLFAEGVLRKWLFPSLSNQVMVVKDVLAVIIVLVGYLKGFIRSNWAHMSVVLGSITFVVTILLGHQNLLVALWGCKILWFGIPMCYVLGEALTDRDVSIILKGTLVLTIVNAGVMLVQFISPGSAWINLLPAGETIKENLLGASAIDSAGMIRPVGTFAHTTQISLFCPLSLGVIVFYLFRSHNLRPMFRVPRGLVYVSLGAYIIVAICSVSRTIIFSSFAILFFLVALFFRFQKKEMFYIFGGLLLVGILLYNVPVINKGIENLLNRFDSASKSSNVSPLEDFYNRIVVYNVDAIINPRDFKGNPPPFWGFGQGMSTQVGGRLLGVGKESSGFSLAEWDALRIMLESGLLMGWLIIFNRLGCVIANFKSVLRERMYGNYLPMCLYGAFFIGFYFYTQWGNSFQLAFSVFCGGLFMAVSNNIVLEDDIE